MINPLPIELRPDFLKKMNATKEQGPNDWLPIVVVGGLCIIVICIIYKDSNDSARKMTNAFNQNDDQPCCPMRPNRSV